MAVLSYGIVEKTPATSLMPPPSAELGRSTDITDESRLWREEREPVELPVSNCWLAAKFRPSSLVALLSALCFPLENNEAMLRVA